MQPEQVLGPIKGMAQDFARDAMPQGYVWSLLDLLPHAQGANLRSRNPWEKLSNQHADWTPGQFPIAGLYSVFSDKRTLVVVAGGTKLYEIDTLSAPPTNATLIGTVQATAQNPFQHRFKIIIPDAAGSSVAKIVSHAAGTYTIANLPGSSTKGKYGCTYKDRVVLAGPAGDDTAVGFSKPGDPTLAWDSLSLIKTSLPVYGIAPLRNSILVFHEASMERIRGDTPPDSTLSDPTGNMLLEPFPDRVGCFDARTICTWRENVIFADERGVHVTDGANTDNLCELGGFLLPWAQIWELGVSAGSAGVIGDLYVITLFLDTPTGLPNPGLPPIGEGAPSEDQLTLLCHIPTRTWTRISNFPATFWAASHGPVEGRERLWWGNSNTRYMAEATDAIFPLHDVADIGEDPDGVAFTPILETPWFPIGGKGRKRVKHAYIGYEFESADPSAKVIVEIAPKLFANAELFEYSELARTLSPHPSYKRLRVPVRKEVDGIALRLTVSGEFNHFAFYDLSLAGWPREGAVLARA